MRKLHLHIGEIIQGEFSHKKLNLLLMFQVNCPGCFIYALPVFNQLFDRFNNQLGFIALSTAFEDFDLNTEENTNLLLNEGELVGETQKALYKQGVKKMPFAINFPVGIDKKLVEKQNTGLIENICNLNPNFSTWSAYDQNLMRLRVANYLNNQKEVSLTFMANQFKGTPTLVLFNHKNELLKSWFGHIPIEEVSQQIEQFIN